MEIYISECCGGVFVPGFGPDNIHKINDPNEDTYHGERHGDCPACGKQTPKMVELGAYMQDMAGGIIGGFF